MDWFVLLQRVVPQKLLTGLVGVFADVKWRPLKNLLIKVFVAKYKVDLGLAMPELDHESATAAQYASFNDFFTRQLRPDARPMDGNIGDVVSPADGVVSQRGSIAKGRLMQAKGIDYSLDALLGERHLGDELEGGEFATIYLSPRDYHRVHMPLAGRITGMRYIPGKLFSVNPRTAANVDSLFARNERLVVSFQADDNLPFVLVMVGAMIVAGIETVACGRISRGRSVRDVSFENMRLDQGQEFGRFYLGSTAIVLFPKAANVQWDSACSSGNFVNVRQTIGRSINRIQTS